MARITPRQRQRYGFLTGFVPGDVLKAIDDRELEERLSDASGLMRQVAKAATPGAGREFGGRAQEILGAPPRAVTERNVAQKIAKAAALGDSPQAADLVRQAREELLRHPPAVRRFDPVAVVRKAAADGAVLACFDQDGNLYGVADPDDVVLDAGDPGEVAAPVAKGSGKPMRAVFDQQQRLVGMIDPDDVIPIRPVGKPAAPDPAEPAAAPVPAASAGPAPAAGVAAVGKARRPVRAPIRLVGDRRVVRQSGR